MNKKKYNQGGRTNSSKNRTYSYLQKNVIVIFERIKVKK